MTVLVTGANGQLGSEIRNLAGCYPGLGFIFTDVAELDLTDKKKVDAFFQANPVEAVVNCAAYTAVDRAESDPRNADTVNAKAVWNLALAAKKKRAFMAHVSTDFVFDGRKSSPYVETDVPSPLSVYGKTKMNGEKAFWRASHEGLIIRTGWLYSSYGGNFVKTIMRLASEKGKLSVIDDQAGTPTYAADLAKMILDILPRARRNRKEIYHYSNEGVASWYDFAKAVCEISGIPCEIKPVGAAEYPTPAKRPHYSVMSKKKIKNDFGISIPYWRDSLKTCLEKIRAEKTGG